MSELKPSDIPLCIVSADGCRFKHPTEIALANALRAEAGFLPIGHQRTEDET